MEQKASRGQHALRQGSERCWCTQDHAKAGDSSFVGWDGTCQELGATWLCATSPLPEPHLFVGCSQFASAELFARAKQVPSTALLTPHHPAPGPGITLFQDQTLCSGLVAPPPRTAAVKHNKLHCQAPAFSREPLLGPGEAGGEQGGTGLSGFQPPQKASVP